VRICGEALQDMKNVNIVYVQLCHNFYQLVDQMTNYSETERNCIDNLWKRLNRFCPSAGDWLEFCKRRQKRGLGIFLPVFFVQLDGVVVLVARARSGLESTRIFCQNLVQ
jgi:hypothetical protein